MVLPKGLVVFRKMYSVERKEHPTLPSWAVRQVVRDHIEKMKLRR